MLAALIAILILGGGSSAFIEYIGEREHAVKTSIESGERQEQALDLLDAIAKRSKEHDKQARKTIKELNKFLETRDDNADMIAALSQRHFASLDSFSSDILDLRFELKEMVSREEWAQIFAD